MLSYARILDLVVIFSVSVLLGACAMKVGQVSPQPNVDAFDEQVANELQVYIDPDIPDYQEIESTSLAKVKLDALRASLKTALQNAFEEGFADVRFVDNKPSEGLGVHLRSVDPKHIKIGSNTVVSGSGENVSSSTAYEVAFQVEYRSYLLQDGERVRTAKGKVVSDESFTLKQHAEQVFSRALEQMSEKMADELFPQPGSLGAGSDLSSGETSDEETEETPAPEPGEGREPASSTP